jgi:hypothetical protein
MYRQTDHVDTRRVDHFAYSIWNPVMSSFLLLAAKRLPSADDPLHALSIRNIAVCQLPATFWDFVLLFRSMSCNIARRTTTSVGHPACKPNAGTSLSLQWTEPHDRSVATTRAQGCPEQRTKRPKPTDRSRISNDTSPSISLDSAMICRVPKFGFNGSQNSPACSLK